MQVWLCFSHTVYAVSAQLIGDTRYTDYGLVYVSWQNNYWTATINYSGKFHEVNVGTLLPDGYRVLDINEHRVIIARDNNFLKLGFSGMRPVEIGRVLK